MSSDQPHKPLRERSNAIDMPILQEFRTTRVSFWVFKEYAPGSIVAAAGVLKLTAQT
jgi:hypothetical protein